MTCKPDQKKVFESEEFYTVKCEACKYFVKVDKYRSCEVRHEWNANNGVDVFSDLRTLDNVAKHQMGSGNLPSPNKGKEQKAPPRHRGRK